MNTNFSSKALAGILLFSTIAGGLAACSNETPTPSTEGKDTQQSTPTTKTTKPKASAKTDKKEEKKAEKATVDVAKTENKELPTTSVIISASTQHQGAEQGMGQVDGYTTTPAFGSFDPITRPTVDPVLTAKQVEWSAASTMMEEARQNLKEKQQILTNAQDRVVNAEGRLARAKQAQADAQAAFDEVNAAHPGALDQLNVAKAELAKANAALDNAKKEQAQASDALTKTKAAVSTAESNLSNAKASVATARQKFNDAKAALDALTASSEQKVEAERTAKERLDGVTPDYTSKKATRDEKQAALTSAQSALTNAQSNLAAAKKAAQSASINWDALTKAQKQEMVRIFLAEMVNDYRIAAGYQPITSRFSVGDKNAQWFADYTKAHPLTEDQAVGLEPVTDPNRSEENVVHSNMDLERYHGTHEGYTFNITGENYSSSNPGANPLEIAANAFKALRNSPLHEANFLDPKANAQAIGLVELDGGVWDIYWQGYNVDSAPEGGMYTTDVEKTYGIDVWQGQGVPQVINASKRACVGSTSPNCQPKDLGTITERTPVDPAFAGKVDLTEYEKAVEAAQAKVAQVKPEADQAAADFAPAEKAYNDAKAAHDKAKAALNASDSDVAKATAAKVAAQTAVEKAEAAVPAAEKAVETAKASVPAAEQRVQAADEKVEEAAVVQTEAAQAHAQAAEEAAPVVKAQDELNAANTELETATIENSQAQTALPVAQAGVEAAQENAVKAADRYDAAGAALGMNVDAPENN